MNPGEPVGVAERPSEDSDVPWLIFLCCVSVEGFWGLLGSVYIMG